MPEKYALTTVWGFDRFISDSVGRQPATIDGTPSSPVRNMHTGKRSVPTRTWHGDERELPPRTINEQANIAAPGVVEKLYLAAPEP